jgi:HD-GYP domain-containing protein (c-di-GMP phosphodiesterase class II)
MGLDPGEIRRLRRAALLHDIGKLAISNRILDKPGRLTRAEREEVKLHPAYSLRILERVDAFADLADLAGSHHERLDGRGYFRGLAADELDTSARVLVVADMYEAMAATRPYRPDMSDRDVIATLKKYSGTAICPEVLGALRTLFARGSIQVAPRNAAA